MKKLLILSLLATSIMLVSCANRTQGAESSPEISAVNQEIDNSMDDLLREQEEQQGRDEELGVKTIRGKLTTDKGMTPRVNCIFIAREFFGQDGKNWNDEVTALKGKKVELKGMVIRHHCGPMEQCLSQGYMDWMREPEYLKKL